MLGNKESISITKFPVYDPKYLIEISKTYPISFNGKTRFTLDLPTNMSKAEIEKLVLSDHRSITYLNGKVVKKMIVIPGKIVNVVF